MTAFATLYQFQMRFERPVASDEEPRVGALLDDATAIIRAQVPQLTDPPPATVVNVVCAMVARVIRNPDGKRSETIDDYSFTRDNAVSVGGLYLTEAEKDVLTSPGAGAFTITPVIPAAS
jgi:hypothetical protein